jgi:rifampicin phosphotransferase
MMPEEAVPTVWSNVNAGEVLPGVVTPLMWSIVTRVMDSMANALLGEPPPGVHRRPLVGLIAGRVYFDLGALGAAVRQMPLLGSLDATQLLGGLQEEPEYAEAVPMLRALAAETDHSGRLAMLRALPRSIDWAYRHRPGLSASFVAGARRRTDRLGSTTLSSMTDAELTAHILDALRSMDQLVDSVGFSGVAMTLFTLFAHVCRQWLADADGRLGRLLITGLGGIASAQAGFAMQALARLVASHAELRQTLEASPSVEAARNTLHSLSPAGRSFLELWDQFMREHGHHGLGELEVANPRWREEPGLILQAIMSAATDPGRSATLEAAGRREADRTALTQQCRQRLRDPVRRRLFDVALRGARGGSIARENGKNEAIRRIAVIRRALLELGDRLVRRGALGARDHVFFLTIPEVEAASGEGGLAPEAVLQITRARRDDHDHWLEITPPPVVVGRYSPAGAHAAAPERLAPASPAAVLRGLPASPGLAVGPARVVLGLHAGGCVMPGEILVAPYTDPGWTPYFLPAAGIVTDMGGLLSHSSIIAREYGIPAVVNVGGATRDIVNGRMLRVDGSLGEVRVL